MTYEEKDIFMKQRFLSLLVLLLLGAAHAVAQSDEVLMKEQVEAWYTGAQQGDAAAQYNLGVSFLKGQGVKQDYAEAAKWFGKAAEGGDLDAIYNLATCYMNGEGVEQDVEKGMKLYQRAAADGHVKATRVLGDCYLFGLGVTKDREQAFRWYRKAA